MNPHNSLSHFEFTDLNNLVLKHGGTVAAPRSKRNVPYVAPRDLPNSTFGEITTGEGIFLGVSAPVIIAGSAFFYAGAGMLSAWSQEFFIGNERKLPWKTIAKRNGILWGRLWYNRRSWTNSFASIKRESRIILSFTQAWKVRLKR